MQSDKIKECKDCKYHSEVQGTYFCDSKIHKRKVLRIDKKDAERDINCLWADDKKVGEQA